MITRPDQRAGPSAEPSCQLRRAAQVPTKKLHQLMGGTCPTPAAPTRRRRAGQPPRFIGASDRRPAYAIGGHRVSLGEYIPARSLLSRLTDATALVPEDAVVAQGAARLRLPQGPVGVVTPTGVVLGRVRRGCPRRRPARRPDERLVLRRRRGRRDHVRPNSRARGCAAASRPSRWLAWRCRWPCSASGAALPRLSP